MRLAGPAQANDVSPAATSPRKARRPYGRASTSLLLTDLDGSAHVGSSAASLDDLPQPREILAVRALHLPGHDRSRDSGEDWRARASCACPAPHPPVSTDHEAGSSALGSFAAMAAPQQSRLTVPRKQVLAFRRRVGALGERLAKGAQSLRRAAWAGLQDSMPRAALLSLHARVHGVGSTTLDDPSLAQLWGPRYNTYVVAKRDFALFSLGRLPDDARGRLRAERMAERLHAHLAGRRMTDREAGGALGVGNALRYATTTGTVAIRWEGARAPTVWTGAAPEIDADAARRELARRYLHVFGPATPDAFARWAGISRRAATKAFESLEG